MFFLTKDQQKIGPFDLSRLQEMMTAGQLQPADPVLPEGTEHWQPAESIDALAKAFRSREAITATPHSAEPRDAIEPVRRRRRRAEYDDDDDDVPSVANREINRQLVTNFRKQIHALGGFWIFIGTVLILFAMALTGRTITDGRGGALLMIAPETTTAAVFVVMGVLSITIGVLTCLKNISAVYVGLVLCYLLALANLVLLNIIGFVILLLVILQGHRVVSWANKMREAGVPRNVKP